jgi:hypothetical protein
MTNVTRADGRWPSVPCLGGSERLQLCRHCPEQTDLPLTANRTHTSQAACLTINATYQALGITHFYRTVPEAANVLEPYLRLPSVSAQACHGVTFTFT